MRVMGGSCFYCSGKANHSVCDGIDGKPEIAAVEQAVYSELAKKFDEIRNICPTRRAQSSPKANKLKMQLETLNSQIDNLVDKITQTTEAIGKVLEERLGKRDSVQSELDKLGGSKPQQSYETVIPMLDGFAEMPVSVQRQIAGEFIKKILLWEDRVEIQWKF